jgi:drug/metabolite transporter (DMT)-like permease
MSQTRVGEMVSGMSLKQLVTVNLALIFNTITWGTFFPVLELQLRHWDMFSASAGRQVTGTIALFSLIACVERRWPIRRGLPWGTIIFLSSIGITCCCLLTTLAVYLSSGLSAAIISATNPIGSALLAQALYGVKLRRAIVVGAILSVAGGLLAVTAGQHGHVTFGLGELSLIAANLVWTWFSLAIQHRLAGYTYLERTAYTILPGAVQLVLIVAALHYFGLAQIRLDLSFWPLAYVFYLGFVPNGIGNYLWLWGISRIGVNVAAMYQNLIPVTAVLVTIWIGIYPSWQQLIGGAVILMGVFYTQIAERRRSRARAASPAASEIAGG